MSGRLLTRVVAMAAGFVLLAGCGFKGAYSLPLPGGSGTGAVYHVKAVFSDVQDLVPMSAVRVNDVAVGIALMLFGTGLAFYLGKPLIEPTAPRLPAIDFGWWSDIAQVRAALRINVLFLIGVALAPILYWAFRTTRWEIGRAHV